MYSVNSVNNCSGVLPPTDRKPDLYIGSTPASMNVRDVPPQIPPGSNAQRIRNDQHGSLVIPEPADSQRIRREVRQLFAPSRSAGPILW